MNRSAQVIIANTLPLDAHVITGHNALLADLEAKMAVIHGTNLITAATFTVGSTDRNVATPAFTFRINGVGYAKAAVAAGTAIGAQTVPADKWALWRGNIDTAGTIAWTAAAANATTGYDTEAAAIAALPAETAGKCDLGYFTVKTKAGFSFVAATDSLLGGATGNVASATNFYPAALAWSTLGQTSPVIYG